jgi:predicted ester cyclase
MTRAAEQARTARHAIEQVCSGRMPGDLERCYAPSFVDHVNSKQFLGHEGARQSVALYQRIFDDLSFTAEQQVSEGDRVATHWTLRGTHRGRSVVLSGITISRFEDGRIVEEWSYSNSMEIVKQIGVWRSVLLLLREWRSLLRRRTR